MFWKKEVLDIKFEQYTRSLKTAVEIVRKFDGLHMQIHILPCDWNAVQNDKLEYLRFTYKIFGRSRDPLDGFRGQLIKERFDEDMWEATNTQLKSFDNEDGNGFTSWCLEPLYMFVDYEQSKKPSTYIGVLKALHKHTDSIEGIKAYTQDIKNWKYGFLAVLTGGWTK